MQKILFVFILYLASLLTGCTVILLGDNAGRPNNNEVRAQRSIEQITADGMITSDIRARYASDVVLKKIRIDTYLGVVRLFGSVPTKNLMERAISLALSVQGVKKVKSGLRLR